MIQEYIPLGQRVESFNVETEITRNEKDMVKIEASNGGTQIYYAIDGSDPTSQSARLYSQPFVFMQKGNVKAVAFDRQQNKKSPIATLRFDIPSSSYKVVGIEDKKTSDIFDGNSYCEYYFPVGTNNLTIELQNKESIRGFIYTPNQRG